MRAQTAGQFRRFAARAQRWMLEQVNALLTEQRHLVLRLTELEESLRRLEPLLADHQLLAGELRTLEKELDELRASVAALERRVSDRDRARHE